MDTTKVRREAARASDVLISSPSGGGFSAYIARPETFIARHTSRSFTTNEETGL